MSRTTTKSPNHGVIIETLEQCIEEEKSNPWQLDELSHDHVIIEKNEELEIQNNGVNESTNQLVNQKDLYEVNETELQKLQEGETISSQSVKS